VENNYLRIYDTVQFSFLDNNWTKVKDNYAQQMYSGGIQQANTDGLLVSIAATHSGIVTRNNGFYLPDRMEKGAQTFVADYPKPILVHHKDHEDNIGRVKRSQYIDTSGTVIEQYDGLRIKDPAGKEIATFNKSMIQDFVTGSLPFGSQVDVVRSIFRDAVLEKDGYAGLGHIQLVANITDPDAIPKIMDGRYLTGSVGATTNKAVCSVCRSDWTETGPCDHKPGAVYDSAKCFIIAGDLSYDEYSLVNTPADRQSKILQLHYNGIQDNIEVADDFGRIYEVKLSFPQYDSVDKEENSMAKNAKEKEGDLDIKDSVTTDPAPETDNADGEKDTQVKDSTSDKTDTKLEDNKVEDNKDDQLIEDSTTDDDNADAKEESIEDFIVRVIDAEDKPSDEDKTRAYQILWDACSAEEQVKLSDKKLKSLTKSQFCDAKHLFPVHDEAHLVAAHKLFSNTKLNDETKEAILATIVRKAKAKGIVLTDNVSSEKIQDSQVTRIMRQILEAMEEDTYYSQEPVLDEEEIEMMRSILKRLSGLVGKDSFVQSLLAENLASDEKALLDEVAKNEEEIGDLRDRLVASQKEYHLLFEDMQNLQDSLVVEKANVRKIKESHLQTLLALKDSEVKENDFSKLGDAEIESKLEDVTKSVDMIKITDKLGNGMSRTPSDPVEDPTVIQDNARKEDQMSVSNLEKINANYLHLRLSRGEDAAEAYLTDMKKKGFLPQE
jgi:hypothetical protein